MSELSHDQSLLGPYILGALDDAETRIVRDHLQFCADCRAELAELDEMRSLLGEVPPEAFLDGPPEGGDLMLRRTLRAIRSETSHVEAPRPSKVSSSRGLPRLAVVAAGVVALAVATLGAGVLIGQRTASTTVAQGPSSASSVPAASQSSSLPADARVVTGTDRPTGTRMTATVLPAAGWVRVHATVAGVPAGKRCELRVVSHSGTSLVAGSWLVSPKGAQDGTTLDGSALVAPADVAKIEVVTFEGQKLISLPV
jgi:anti-sigma factor RsiW